MTTGPSVLDDLVRVVGREHVLIDDDVRAGYEVDWTGRFRGDALAVVRPASTAEVAAIVRWARRHRVALVPQGGNTGLVGGSVPPSAGTRPDRHAVVVSLRRLDAIDAPDLVAGQLTVGAGTTLAALQERLAGTRWAFGVDLGARDSATIGGMIATNAGGTRVLRYGAMRAQLLGVEAVLGDGSVISHLGGLVKDNTGYDLAGLLCGSEGTLGIVTAARLRLVPEPADRLVCLAAVADTASAVALAAHLRSDVDGIDALEAVLDGGVDLVCEQLGLPPPFAGEHSTNVIVLVEWAGSGEPPIALARILAPFATVAADDSIGRQRLWAYRERMTEAIARTGVPHKLDVTLPLARLAPFVDDVHVLVDETHPGACVHLFGHLGDGNVHVNIVGPAPDDDRVDGTVLSLVAAYGGSISAEHGIGRAKVDSLSLCRTQAEIDAFARIKAALDPDNIMNPGVILPAPSLR